MSLTATIENGFAVIDAGAWLVGRGQPAAFLGEAVRRRRKGWFLRDRSSLYLVETTGRAWCADVSRPFLTHIPCAAPINAVSAKVIVAPAAAWTGTELVKVVPMSCRGSLVVSKFGILESESLQLPTTPTTELPNHFVVMATASRTTRISVPDGDTLTVRPDALVAWTGNKPTGFIRKLGIWDVLLPRTPRDLVLHFHGPCIVWIEGTGERATGNGKWGTGNGMFGRRTYGV